MKTKFLILILCCSNSLSLFAMGNDWQLCRKGWQYANPFDIRNELLSHVKVLINNNKDLSIPVKGYIRPPIIEACAYGFEEIVELLLQAGENPDRSFLGDSCLHVATFYGHLNIVKKLLSYNASKFRTNDKGNTAIDIAKQSNNKKIRDFFENLQKNDNLRQNY